MPRIFLAMVLFTAAVRSQVRANEAQAALGSWLPTAAELSENPFDEARK